MPDQALASASSARQAEATPPCPPRGSLWKELADPKRRRALRKASVILALDVHETDKMYLFYGKEMLEQLIGTGACRHMDVVKVAVDFFTDDVEVLWAACVAMKGSCCYEEFAEVRAVDFPGCR